MATINPIVVSKEEWARIVHWTDENREDKDAAHRREYLKYLSETSANMTKSWPNSLQNVNKRNEEIRRARIDAAEQANTKFYQRYVKHQKEEQEKTMYNARDTIFKNKDAPKLLLSGVIESVVLKEREEQVKFNKKYLGQYQREQKRLTDELIQQKAKEWHELQEEKKRRRFAVNKQHQKDLVEQANESSERKRKEYEEELNMQRLDILNANKEIADIKEFEEQYKEAERARIHRDNQLAMQETAVRRAEQAAKDSMEERLIGVLNRARARTEARRRATEKEIRDEKLRLLAEISKKLESGEAARDAREQASRDKAVRERDAQVEARHRKQLEKEARFRRERVEARELFLRDEARRLHEQHTLQQWKLMNRFKNQEIYEDFKEQLRLEKERKTKEYRDEINRLRKEREDRENKEKAELRYFYGPLAEKKLRDEDNKLLSHAAALLEEAKQHGRPTLPIHKAIDRYCKMYRLYPMPELPASLQEHFKKYAPWDGSRPDQDYEYPKPPVFDSDKTQAGGGHRDGLQPLAKPAEPKKTEEKKEDKKEEKVQDYKRQGRANGLQRRPSVQEMICMPAIGVAKIVPCKQVRLSPSKDVSCTLVEKECRCEEKPSDETNQ